MRPGYERKRCIDCGATRAEALDHFISTNGLCKLCGLKRQLDNVDGIAARQGPYFQRWRLGICISQLPTEVVGQLYAAGMFSSEAA
jgi:hypothetical protein